MNPLHPNERLLVGQEFMRDGKVVADDVASRINALIATHLTPIAVDDSGWFRLYRDDTDGRYWELSYPHGEWHGGGLPMLALVALHDVKERYQLS